MAKIKKDLEEKIRRAAKNRCGYCLNPQGLMPYKLEIEHLVPKALGGESVEENLWLACRECNAHKAKKIEAIDNLTEKTVKLFNVGRQKSTSNSLWDWWWMNADWVITQKHRQTNAQSCIF